MKRQDRKRQMEDWSWELLFTYAFEHSEKWKKFLDEETDNAIRTGEYTDL